MQWPLPFDDVQLQAPATNDEVAALAGQLDRALPKTYCDFLRWSNGGWARTGEREFGFFDTYSVREYLESYEFAEYMPGAVPFALDGGGIFYVFDFRNALVNEEYLVWVCGSGSNTWEDAVVIASTFLEACQGTSPVSSILFT